MENFVFHFLFWEATVGDGALDVPSAEGGSSVQVRNDLPIEVKLFRLVVEDADPYDHLWRC